MRSRRPKAESPVSLAAHLAIAAMVVCGALAIYHAPARASYTLVGVPLLLLAMLVPAAAWHIAITLTYTAFALDYRKYHPELPQMPLLGAVVISALGVAWLVARWRSARLLFLTLLWAAVGFSLLKAFVPRAGPLTSNLEAMELLFVLMAAGCTWLVPRRAMRVSP